MIWRRITDNSRGDPRERGGGAGESRWLATPPDSETVTESDTCAMKISSWCKVSVSGCKTALALEGELWAPLGSVQDKLLKTVNFLDMTHV
jgi:hypothetical protein